jgi:hypothetical protein
MEKGKWDFHFYSVDLKLTVMTKQKRLIDPPGTRGSLEEWWTAE